MRPGSGKPISHLGDEPLLPAADVAEPTKTSPAGTPLDERFHKLGAIAAQLALSRRELYREVAEGHLVVHRFGRAIRIAERDLKQYIAARRCPPEKSDGLPAQQGRGRAGKGPKGAD